jgi:uncharacterized tellurite resistance protein B-like protein
MGILEFLGLRSADLEAAESGTEAAAVRRIADSLDRMDPERARHVATFAFILCRVAHADMEVSDDETRKMERIVMELGRLPEEQAILVVQMAKTQNTLFGGTQNYLVTREFNRIATHDDKLALLECLFAVSASDETITTAENTVIQQIASELKLDRRDVARVRTLFKEHLAVLRDPPTP